MRRKRRKSRKYSFVRLKWIILFLVIAIPLFHLGRRVYKVLNSNQEEQNLKRRILVLEAENEVLRNRIGEYRKGNLLEAKARDDLGMIKKGEKIYLVIKNDL
jgi:cell division protein FtsB